MPTVRKFAAKQPDPKHPIPCLIKGCTRPAMSRGLCTSCRVLARNAVVRGDVTEEKLMDLKLLGPKHNRHGDSFTAVLNAALEAEAKAKARKRKK
jgi:hypothetical protein